MDDRKEAMAKPADLGPGGAKTTQASAPKEDEGWRSENPHCFVLVNEVKWRSPGLSDVHFLS